MLMAGSEQGLDIGVHGIHIIRVVARTATWSTAMGEQQ